MRLSDLNTGESGVIVKVNGHGGFRKRIIEMGFIKGKKVEVLLNAPLQDPVKYRIMGYEISLRREEADLIEVVTDVDIQNFDTDNEEFKTIYCTQHERLSHVANIRHKELKIAFVGNPNCGKTSLFNYVCGAHERVGNYSGVTIDAKDGYFNYNGYKFHIIDLPGTYSLTAYSPEELYVRKYIIEQTPDVIVNIVDSTNLERNLYLTSQLIDLDVPIVIALNMYDDFRKTGNLLNTALLSTLLGTPAITTIARTGEGVDELFNTIIDIHEGHETAYRHIHVNHGKVIESAIENVEDKIRVNPEPHFNYSGRFLAIKLLENDSQIDNIAQRFGNYKDIMEVCGKSQKKIFEELGEDSESAIANAKYGFIQGALKECFEEKSRIDRAFTRNVDYVVTNKYLGFPIFLVMLYLMFYCTFTLGQYPTEWIEIAVEYLGSFIAKIMPQGPLNDMIVNGIIGGVGGVIVFLPNILILYAFISWMEDSGYMARAAFIMDKIMHRMGLHGKSFIPMVMGFGCNIPAILATRTIEDKKSRLITMLIIPLMSCSARLPVYIIIISAFFPYHSALVLFSIYLIGILCSVLMAKIFNRFVVKGESSPFVMELPPYRIPSAKSVARHSWDKGKEYLHKMGTTILLASIAVWALSYYPHRDGISSQAQLEQSYIGKIGQAIEPVIKPCGFDWREGVSILAGVGAKEIVASTMGVLFSQGSDNNDNFEFEGNETNGNARLSQQLLASGLTPLAAFSFIIFVLLYMPCIATCIAIKNESGKWKWAIFTAIYTTVLAWIASAIIYNVGSLIGLG